MPQTVIPMPPRAVFTYINGTRRDSKTIARIGSHARQGRRPDIQSAGCRSRHREAPGNGQQPATAPTGRYNVPAIDLWRLNFNVTKQAEQQQTIRPLFSSARWASGVLEPPEPGPDGTRLRVYRRSAAERHTSRQLTGFGRRTPSGGTGITVCGTSAWRRCLVRRTEWHWACAVRLRTEWYWV